MTKPEMQNMVIKLGCRAQEVDRAFETGRISQERYATERTAIDVVISFVSEEIGYQPYKYLRYCDVIVAKELAEAKDKLIQRLETEYRNKAEADARAQELFNAFMAGMNSGSFKAK